MPAGGKVGLVIKLRARLAAGGIKTGKDFRRETDSDSSSDSDVDDAGETLRGVDSTLRLNDGASQDSSVVVKPLDPFDDPTLLEEPEKKDAGLFVLAGDTSDGKGVDRSLLDDQGWEVLQAWCTKFHLSQLELYSIAETYEGTLLSQQHPDFTLKAPYHASLDAMQEMYIGTSGEFAAQMLFQTWMQRPYDGLPSPPDRRQISFSRLVFSTCELADMGNLELFVIYWSSVVLRFDRSIENALNLRLNVELVKEVLEMLHMDITPLLAFLLSQLLALGELAEAAKENPTNSTVRVLSLRQILRFAFVYPIIMFPLIQFQRSLRHKQLGTLYWRKRHAAGLVSKLSSGFDCSLLGLPPEYDSVFDKITSSNKAWELTAGSLLIGSCRSLEVGGLEKPESKDELAIDADGGSVVSVNQQLGVLLRNLAFPQVDSNLTSKSRSRFFMSAISVSRKPQHGIGETSPRAAVPTSPRSAVPTSPRLTVPTSPRSPPVVTISEPQGLDSPRTRSQSPRKNKVDNTFSIKTAHVTIPTIDSNPVDAPVSVNDRSSGWQVALSTPRGALSSPRGALSSPRGGVPSQIMLSCAICLIGTSTRTFCPSCAARAAASIKSRYGSRLASTLLVKCGESLGVKYENSLGPSVMEQSKLWYRQIDPESDSYFYTSLAYDTSLWEKQIELPPVPVAVAPKKRLMGTVKIDTGPVSTVIDAHRHLYNPYRYLYPSDMMEGFKQEGTGRAKSSGSRKAKRRVVPGRIRAPA